MLVAAVKTSFPKRFICPQESINRTVLSRLDDVARASIHATKVLPSDNTSILQATPGSIALQNLSQSKPDGMINMKAVRDIMTNLSQNSMINQRCMLTPPDAFTSRGISENLMFDKNRLADVCVDNIDELSKATDVPISEVSMVVATSVLPTVPCMGRVLKERMRSPFSDSTWFTSMQGDGCGGGASGLGTAFRSMRDSDIALIQNAEMLSSMMTASFFEQLMRYGRFYDDDIWFNKSEAVGVGILPVLFGDGLAHTLIVGKDHPHYKRLRDETKGTMPHIIDAVSYHIPGETSMRMDINSNGFSFILPEPTPRIASKCARKLVDDLCARNNLSQGDIEIWVCHTGGKRVLEKVSESLGFNPDITRPDHELRHSVQSLAAHGNCSSVSVTNVLERTTDEIRTSGRIVPPGTKGILMAFGPAANSWAVLLEW